MESTNPKKPISETDTNAKAIEANYPWYAVPYILGIDTAHPAKAALFSPNREALYNRIYLEKLEEHLVALDQRLKEEPLEMHSDDTKAESVPSPLEIVPSPKAHEPPFPELERMQSELDRQLLSEAVQASLLIETEDLAVQLTNSDAEEKIEGRPEASLEEISDTPRSFTEWLRDISEEPPLKNHPAGQTQPDIISRFMKEALKPERPATFIPIHRPKAVFFSPEKMVEESLRENEDFITETLANVYTKQGSVKKAIRAYEILMQKHPEKSAYFAALINELKKK